jgi:hypothetical protein
MIPFGGVLFLLLAAPAQFSSAWGTYPDDSDLVRRLLRGQDGHALRGPSLMHTSHRSCILAGCRRKATFTLPFPSTPFRDALSSRLRAVNFGRGALMVMHRKDTVTLHGRPSVAARSSLSLSQARRRYDVADQLSVPSSSPAQHSATSIEDSPTSASARSRLSDRRRGTTR